MRVTLNIPTPERGRLLPKHLSDRLKQKIREKGMPAREVEPPERKQLEWDRVNRWGDVG